MPGPFSLTAAWSLIVAGAVTASVPCVSAQTMAEYSAETRFQLDLHVPDAALAAFLPAGWAPNVATQGPAKDANLRVIFIDRLTINGPDGKPGLFFVRYHWLRQRSGVRSSESFATGLVAAWRHSTLPRRVFRLAGRDRHA